MSLRRFPQLRDEHSGRLVVTKTDLIKKAACLAQITIGTGENRDELIAFSVKDAKCAAVREYHGLILGPNTHGRPVKAERTPPVSDKVDFKKTLDSYQATGGQFRVLEVPTMHYLMIDGHGDPNTSPGYAHALEGIYRCPTK